MIVFIGGAPGSGKSTLATFLAAELGLEHLDIEDLSRLHSPQLFGDKAWKNLKQILRKKLSTKCDLVVTATFRKKSTRKKFFDIAKWRDKKIIALFLMPDSDIVITRASRRNPDHYDVNAQNAREIISNWYKKFMDEDRSNIGYKNNSPWLIIDNEKMKNGEILQIVKERLG